MRTLIRNGRIIDPKNNIDDVLDIVIDNNVISIVEKNVSGDFDKTIDAKNNWVVPGLIDLHVHMRDPGLTYKEDIYTGSNSAKAGGVTTTCVMPNTKPVIDNNDILKYIHNKSKETDINILPICSITKGMKGEELVDFVENNELSIAFSEDGFTVDNAKLMYDALNLSNKLNKPIFAHCEDHLLKDGGQIHEGEISKKFNLKGITPLAEDIIVNRDVLLAKDLKAKLHICHIATEGSVEILREHKKYNPNLTAEICPHHFVLSDEDITSLDPNFKMAPPLRSKKDVQAMLNALKDDIIDVIATDHAPHSIEEKTGDFEKAFNGIVGLETLVPLTITYLVKKNILSAKQFVEKTSLNPAKIINFDRGHLSVGAVADIAIINIDEKFKMDASKFSSKSKNTPFDNYEVFGKVLYTICNGKVVYERI